MMASRKEYRLSAERRSHVLGLNPREQYLVRILLSNLMAGYVDKAIQEAPMMKTMEAADKKAAGALTLFWRYNEMCDLLCPESMLGRARSKVIMLDSSMMKYLVMAAQGFDPRNNMLSDKHRGYLQSGFEDLKKKIVDSAQFTYSQWEIDKAKNTGQG
jgi:hypothetical protein